MTVLSIHYRSLDLPWTLSEDEEQRFRRILRRLLLALLLLSLILPFLPVPEIERQDDELPPRLAKLILEREAPPPAPAEIKTPEPQKAEPKPLAPKKAGPRKPPPPKPVETARERASRAGLLALKDDLADLRTNTVTSKLERNPVAASAPSAEPARSPDRALITSKATTGSGGIQTARMSRDTGGGGLAGRSTTRVASPVGAGGDNGTTVQRGSSSKSSRSVDDVRLAIDRNKGAIYALYHRALRQDPSLQGKVVLKFTIAPSGQVIDLKIISSELRAPALERKLLARIRQINFGARNVDTLVVNFPIDFLPS